MPPSLREWLAEEHLAWFMLDVVSQLDLSAIEGAIQGKDPRGQRPAPPVRLWPRLWLFVLSARQPERQHQAASCRGSWPLEIRNGRYEYDRAWGETFLERIAAIALISPIAGEGPALQQPRQHLARPARGGQRADGGDVEAGIELGQIDTTHFRVRADEARGVEEVLRTDAARVRAGGAGHGGALDHVDVEIDVDDVAARGQARWPARFTGEQSATQKFSNQSD